MIGLGVMVDWTVMAGGDEGSGEGGRQILIEAYAIDFEEGRPPADLADGALVGGEKGQGVAAVFDEGRGFELLRELERLEGKRKLEFLAAPRMVTRDGQRAKFESVRELIYPTEYDPPEIPGDLDLKQFKEENRGGGVFPVTPANPTAFEVRMVGFTFEYDAEVMAEGGVRMRFEIEDVRFKGFVNYGSPIKTSVEKKGGKSVEVVLTENRILMPVFSKRAINTSIDFGDGGWVFLGGVPELDEPEMAQYVVNFAEDGEVVKDVEKARGPVFFLLRAKVAGPRGGEQK
ncbi:MAG: hypothetical protein AAF591_01360 [Verrucomicrobiota bacterium]